MAASNATARRRGKDWERDVRTLLREAGFDYEQLRQTGTKDEGDGVIRLPNGTYVVVEAKNTQRLDLAGHLTEAEVEADNFAKHRFLDRLKVFGVVFQKRRGINARKAYAVMTVEDLLRLLAVGRSE